MDPDGPRDVDAYLMNSKYRQTVLEDLGTEGLEHRLSGLRVHEVGVHIAWAIGVHRSLLKRLAG